MRTVIAFASTASKRQGRSNNVEATFVFARPRYMNGIRAWSAGHFGGIGAPAVASPPMGVEPPPGMVRSISGSMSSESLADEAMSDDKTSGPPNNPLSGMVCYVGDLKDLDIDATDVSAILEDDPTNAHDEESLLVIGASESGLLPSTEAVRNDTAFESRERKSARERVVRLGHLGEELSYAAGTNSSDHDFT